MYYSPVALQTLCFQRETHNQDEPVQRREIKPLFDLNNNKMGKNKDRTQNVLHAIYHSLIMEGAT